MYYNDVYIDIDKDLFKPKLLTQPWVLVHHPELLGNPEAHIATPTHCLPLPRFSEARGCLLHLAL